MTPGIIYQGYGYTASLAGLAAINGPFLCVTRNSKGKYLSGQQAIDWHDHIITAIDSKESAALCRAIYQG